MYFIYKNPLGIFVLDEDGNVLEFKRFKGSIEDVVKKFKEKSEEEKEIIKKYKNYKYIYDREVLEKLDDLLKYVKIDKREYYDYLHRFSIELAKYELKESFSNQDNLIIQAVESLEDVDQVINILIARLKEFYGLHFPELIKIVRNNRKIVELVSKYKSRENFKEYKNLAKESAGADFDERDLNVVHRLSKILEQLYRYRETLESYIKERMREYAPNLSEIAGPLLGAKLLSMAGGLKKLATLPASTIQVIGAEKALFKHLSGKATPPKHGILFQHYLVRNFPKKYRGKIARSLAAKIAIAAKLDAFSNRYYADKLKRDLMKRVDEIKKEMKTRKKKIIERKKR